MLLTSYCDWTEYTLYLLAAEDASRVGPRPPLGRRPGGAGTPARRSAAQRLGASPARPEPTSRGSSTLRDPGLFAVVQSSSGLSAAAVAAAAAGRFEVRRTELGPAPAAESASQFGERLRIASRLAAQGTYRARRGLRRRAPKLAR